MDATIAPLRAAFMLDTGDVPAIDFNVDIGEAQFVLTSDRTLLTLATSANIACGGHAGTNEVIAATVGGYPVIGCVISADFGRLGQIPAVSPAGIPPNLVCNPRRLAGRYHPVGGRSSPGGGHPGSKGRSLSLQSVHVFSYSIRDL